MGAAVEKRERLGIETMTVQVPWKAILWFSIPLFIGSLFQQIYSMADAVIVGRLVGVKELAGVGATGAMSFLVLGFATGITSGFSVVIAQRAGAEDREQIRISVAACCWLCIAVTVVMTILSVAGADFLLRIMNTPDDIFRYASGYIRIIFGGLGASIYYNMIAGILRAVGDSRTPLYFLIFSSVFNVVLDIAAVLVFHGGVEGASFATVISQLISAFLCHWYAGRKYPGIWPEKRHWSASLSQGWRHLRIGLPMALQFSVTAVGIMILQAYLNGFGSVVIAGYTAAGKVENLVTQPFTTLAAAMEVYCGQNYGAGRPDRIRKGIKNGRSGSCRNAGFECSVWPSDDPDIFGILRFGNCRIWIYLSGDYWSIFYGTMYAPDCPQLASGDGRSPGAHGGGSHRAGCPMGWLHMFIAVWLCRNLFFHSSGLGSGTDASSCIL